jgi:hypothetical protein
MLAAILDFQSPKKYTRTKERKERPKEHHSKVLGLTNGLVVGSYVNLLPCWQPSWISHRSC